MKKDMQIYNISTCPPRTVTFTIAHIKLYSKIELITWNISFN